MKKYVISKYYLWKGVMGGCISIIPFSSSRKNKLSDLFNIFIFLLSFPQSDMSSLDESNSVHNNQLVFSVVHKELGIPPVMSPNGQIDKLSMVLYITQIKDALTLPPKGKYFCLCYFFTFHKFKSENYLHLN